MDTLSEKLRFDLVGTLKAHNFPYYEHIIHAFVGGSELHGAKLENTDDHDIMGVYLEPPEDMMGLHQKPHFVWSTSGTETKNGPDDVDVTLYGLQKWTRLAVKGNPSILNFLFAPWWTKSPEPERYPNYLSWLKVTANREALVARTHWKQFAGYATAQLSRMCGERSRKCNRPELVEKYGYDTKFAMHTLRILSEGTELIETGVISFPAREVELLKEIRRGERTEEWVINEAKRRLKYLEELGTGTATVGVRETINYERVSDLLAWTYQEYWDAKGLNWWNLRRG